MGDFTGYILNVDSEILKSGEKIRVGKDNISIDLLRSLLSDKYFNEILKMYNNKRNRINFYAKKKGIIVHNSYTLSNLSRAFNILLTMNISNIEKQRINSLISLNDFDSFIKLEQDAILSCNIDHKSYSISCNEMISFLILNEEEYEKALKRKYFKDELLTMHALYIIKNINHRYLDKYVFPSYIVDRIKNIQHSKDVDIEAFNQINETESCWLNKTVLDEEFEQEILNSIPSDLNLVEKTIYLYILLCRTMTYDPYYFAYDKDDPCNINHQSISYLKKINKKVNRIVCYEFLNIFGYFLDGFGVHFEVFSNEEFYQYHSSVVYRIGKFLISADAVTSILSGDIVRCKLGFPMVGLGALNENAKTQREFKDMVDKVYDLFKREKIEIAASGYNESILNRLKAIIKYANSYHLDIIDKFAFIYLYKKVSFTSHELEDLSYVVLRNNDKNSLVGVFTINIDGEYLHFTYEYNGELQEISDSDLKMLMDNETLSYVPNSLERVPFKVTSKRKVKY